MTSMQITGLEASSTMPQREEALGFFPLGHLRCCLPSRGPLHPPPPRGRLTLPSIAQMASFNLCSQCLQDAARTRLGEARLPGSLIPGCVMLKLTRAVQGGQGPWRDTQASPLQPRAGWHPLPETAIIIMPTRGKRPTERGCRSFTN